MVRTSQSEERRREFVPILARAFAELGYRRASTAELAERCGVRENILYRLWKDKRAMFIASLDYIYTLAESRWRASAVGAGDSRGKAEKMLLYEASHHGEFGHYRVVFAGLSEADDPVIRKALQDMYRKFVRFIAEQVAALRGASGPQSEARSPDVVDSAWAMVGLGTILDIAKELNLMTATQRQRVLLSAGRLLMKGDSP